MGTSSLILLWFSIEINLFRFIILILLNETKIWLTVKYFLIQGFGSIVIILNIVLKIQEFSWYFLTFGVVLKLGIAPIHFWFIYLFNNTSSLIAFILRTSQKIIPLRLRIIWRTFSIQCLALVNILFRIIGPIISSSSKFIFAYSSLLTLRWVFLSNHRWAFWYLFLYSFGLAIYFLETQESEQANLRTLKFRSALLCFTIGIIRLAGVPPIARFWVKVLILRTLIKNLKLILRLILGSIFYLYFYFNFTWTYFCIHEGNFFFVRNFLKKSSRVITIVLILFLLPAIWIWNIGVQHEKIWPF